MIRSSYGSGGQKSSVSYCPIFGVFCFEVNWQAVKLVLG